MTKEHGQVVLLMARKWLAKRVDSSYMGLTTWLLYMIHRSHCVRTGDKILFASLYKLQKLASLYNCKKKAWLALPFRFKAPTKIVLFIRTIISNDATSDCRPVELSKFAGALHSEY